MVLTGKAKEHYKIWFDENYNDYWTYYQSKPTILNALIIEWFDSVGIYVNSSGLTLSKTFISDVSVDDNCEYNYDGFRIRKEALTEAIKKANEIYNGL